MSPPGHPKGEYRSAQHEGAPVSTWHSHRLVGDLGPHAAAWDALNHAKFGDHPLLDSRFWNGLLRHFGNPNVVLWVLQDGPTVLAMCLLVRKSWGVWASYLPNQAQLGPVMLTDPAMARSLLAAMGPGTLQLDLLCLDPLLGGQDPAPQHTDIDVTLHALTMRVDTSGSFDDYWAQRSSGLRQNLRRQVRQADALDMVFEHRSITQADQLAAAVNRYAVLESSGWKGLVRTALALDNAQTAFYADLLTNYGATGQAAAHELWLGDQLVASRLTVHANGMLVMLKTCYDEALASHAPGWRLLTASLQACFADPTIRVVEFYTNATQGQLPWADSTRWIRHLSVFGAGAAGTVWHGLRTTKQVLAAVLRPPDLSSTLASSAIPLDSPWPADVLKLFNRADDSSLEVSPGWYQNLHRTVFSQHADAALWVLRNRSEALAAIPVVVDRGRLGGNLGGKLSVLRNYYTAYYAPTLAINLSARELAELLRQIVKHYRPLGQLVFEPMNPAADTALRLQSALQQTGLVCHRYFRFGNWYLHKPGSYADFLKGRSANLRSRIKRVSKRMAEDGGCVEFLTAPTDLARGLAAYWQVYRASWKQDEPYPDFIDGLALWAAQTGALRLGVLWLHDQPIAAQLWLVAHGKAEIVKVAYDEAHKDLSPGTVLTAALMAHVLDVDGVLEVDFLIGDDAYKHDWMSHRRERWGVVAHNPFSAHGLTGVLRMLLGRLARGQRVHNNTKPSA